MRLFFYGTLMDSEVRERVLGRDVPHSAITLAEVAGFRRVFVAGRTYPMLVPHAGCTVDGLVVDGLTEDELRRLVRYEGPEYQLLPLPVATAAGPQTALVFLCLPSVRSERREWRFDQWRLRYKSDFLKTIPPVVH
jgi:gamma-glutamylcyclotransferase (GGCT)/AIG2-like uncharacterized protein YtfP